MNRRSLLMWGDLVLGLLILAVAVWEMGLAVGFPLLAGVLLMRWACEWTKG